MMEEEESEGEEEGAIIVGILEEEEKSDHIVEEKTIRVVTHIKKAKLIGLFDTGNTHDFIKSLMEKRAESIYWQNCSI